MFQSANLIFLLLQHFPSARVVFQNPWHQQQWRPLSPHRQTLLLPVWLIYAGRHANIHRPFFSRPSAPHSGHPKNNNSATEWIHILQNQRRSGCCSSSSSTISCLLAETLWSAIWLVCVTCTLFNCVYEEFFPKRRKRLFIYLFTFCLFISSCEEMFLLKKSMPFWTASVVREINWKVHQNLFIKLDYQLIVSVHICLFGKTHLY